MKRLACVIVATFLLMSVFVSGCSLNNKSSTSSEYINIGVSYPLESVNTSTLLYKGLQLAVEQVNAQGGVLSKKIQLVVKDDSGTVTEGAKVAQSFVGDETISAVIGHWNSRVTLGVEGIYARGNMLMLTPASTNPAITTQGYTTIFQSIVNDTVIGKELARYAAKGDYKNIVIVYADDSYGRGLANSFEQAGLSLGVTTVDRVTTVVDSSMPALINRWQAFDADAIFVANVSPDAENTIKTIRAAGCDLPIIGSTGIDRIDLISTLGKYAEGLKIPTIFNPEQSDSKTAKFVQDFKTRYDVEPDSWAAQGYTAIMLLAKAVENANSTSPESISKATHEIKNFSTVFGDISCTADGQLINSTIWIKTVQNGQYQFLTKMVE